MLFAITFSLTACENPLLKEGSSSDSSVIEDTQEIDLLNDKKIIKTITVDKKPIFHNFSYLGMVKATEEINLPARGNGVVENIYVKEGDFVEKNDVLIDLKDPNGENTTQINLEMAKNTLKNTKDALENIKLKTTENINATKISLSSSKQRLIDAEETLNKTQSQNNIIIRSSESQLQNLKNTLFRIQTSLNLSERQLGLSSENIEDLTDISFKNIYKSLELAILSTLPSIVLNLDNAETDLPNGFNSLENELENLERQIKKADEDDFDDLEDLILDLEDYIKDFAEYFQDNDFFTDTDLRGIRASSIPSLQALESQLQNMHSLLQNSEYSLESLELNYEAQTKILLDQIETIQDQIKLQAIALENTIAQTGLGEHSINSSINLIKKEIESKESALKLAQIGKNSEMEQAENSIENAKYQLEQSTVNANYLEVKATTSGKISNLSVELGQIVNGSTVIASIFQENKNQVEIFINPEDIDNFEIGDKAYIIINNDPQKHLGEISKINSTANKTTHLVLVTINLIKINNKLIPNSIVNIELPVFISDTEISIPLNNVFIRESGNYVFLEKNGIAKKQMVITGNIFESNIIIKSGLKNGDKLITNGLMELKDGDNVTIE